MNWDNQIERISKIEEKRNIENNPWRDKLIRNSKGIIENHIDNFILYLSESDDYKGRLKYNTFLQQKEIDGREFRDGDQADIYVSCERELCLSSHIKIDTAVNYILNRNEYNPIINYLNDLIWDGEKRIETIFINCFQVDDTQLVRVLSKKWFIAAVKRVFEPGCQFDNMIVLQGPTGIGKTTFCRLLSNNFYSELKFDEIGNKDIVDKLNKSWIAIIDEMDNFGKKEMASIKSFLSVKKDVVRLAYSRNTNIYQRHCIFIGSLNDETFLKDITTSVERRFWIFKCKRDTMSSFITDTLTQEFVDQLWAEAMYYYKENPNQYLDIESEYQKEFAEDQLQYKIFNSDYTIEWVKNILEKPYSVKENGEFNSDDDFLNQFNETNVYTGVKRYINKIPIASLMYVLNCKYKDKRSEKTIIQALGDEWECKPIWYYGRTIKKGLYRKEPKINVVCDESESLPI